MTSQSKLPVQADAGLVDRDLAEFGVARFRDQVFDAVKSLWDRREREGWTKKHLAKIIGRDPGWVSTNLRAPGNWTLRTAGELIQGLGGEAELQVAALEDPIENPRNYDAYNGYRSSNNSQKSHVVMVTISNPMAVDFTIRQGQTLGLVVMAPPLAFIPLESMP
jgi:hypothetical protein